MKQACYIILICFCLSCKQVHQKQVDVLKPHYTSHSGSEASWDLYFPDTVELNKKYNGKLVYKGILDTITISFDDEHNRYIQAVLNDVRKIKLGV
jgi:hypothetical protein